MILGITGSFASGKTTVAKMFTRLGAVCIDADKIYHQLIKSKGVSYRKIVAAFGRKILSAQGQISRKKLAKIVFSNLPRLKILCQITHPEIIKRIKDTLTKLQRIKGVRVIVIDAPLLIEAGLMEMIDKLVVVVASKDKQITRCKKFPVISKNEVIQRIKSQIPLAQKIKLADFVIFNNGSLKQTRTQVKEVWRQIK